MGRHGSWCRDEGTIWWCCLLDWISLKGLTTEGTTAAADDDDEVVVEDDKVGD